MSSIKRTTLLAFILVPVFLAAFSWFACGAVERWDDEIFSNILMAAGTVKNAAHIPGGNESILALMLLVISWSGFVAGTNLARTARLIVAGELLAASVLLQCLTAYLSGIQGHPIGYTIALALSVGAGALFRTFIQREQIYESQYFQLLQQNRELERTRLQLVKQDEVERRTLAADLHDQVLNDLKLLKQKLSDSAYGSESEDGKEIARLVTQATEQVREVMDSLSPSVLEHIGLFAAIEDCVRRGSERGGYAARFRRNADPVTAEKLSKVEQSLLYRLVQEAVTNICKHAQATTVTTTLDTKGERLIITITDDGMGFDFSLIDSQSRGLGFMRERANLIGATITWQRGPDNKGTVVVIEIALTGNDESSDH